MKFARAVIGALSAIPLLAAGAAAQSADSAKVVDSAYDNINLAVSGQVNRMVNIANDGEETEVFHVDNDNASTRLRLEGTGRLNENWSLGSTIEVQIESNSSAVINQVNESAGSGISFTERKLEAWFQHRLAGKLTIGQGDTASNGTAEVDLSGTTVVAYSGIDDLAGGLSFRTTDGFLFLPFRIGALYDNLDGLGRDDRLRYDMPNLFGVTLSASAIADGRWDAAARYGGDFGTVKLAAAVGFARTSAIDYQVSGSLSALVPNVGISITGALATRKLDEPGADNLVVWYAKLGWQSERLTSVGQTAFSIDFARLEEFGTFNVETTSLGAFAVQRFDRIGTELYAGVRHHEVKADIGANFDPIIVGTIGTRVKF